MPFQIIEVKIDEIVNNLSVLQKNLMCTSSTSLKHFNYPKTDQFRIFEK
jgi:hypothetical protein